MLICSSGWGAEHDVNASPTMHRDPARKKLSSDGFIVVLLYILVNVCENIAMLSINNTCSPQ
jgi:hypothetical protein